MAARMIRLGVVLALSLVLRQSAHAQSPNVLAEQDRARALAEHTAALDVDLARMQRNTRVYFSAWTATNLSLASAQIAIALTTDSKVVRSNYFVGAGLSTAGLVALLAQPWPGLRAHNRFRAMPAGNVQELSAKVVLGERLLARQMHRDALAIGIFKHVIAGTVALGAGIRAGLSFDSVAQGIGRTLFVLVVLEGQILTNPGHYFTPRSDRQAARGLVGLTMQPWLDRHVAGLQLAASF